MIPGGTKIPLASALKAKSEAQDIFPLASGTHAGVHDALRDPLGETLHSLPKCTAAVAATDAKEVRQALRLKYLLSPGGLEYFSQDFYVNR